MKIKKYPLGLILSLIFLSSAAFCFEPVSTCDLLMSYLENDTTLKKNVIDAQKAQLSLDSTNISNGFDITVSTGTFSLSFDDNGAVMSVKPSVKASVPQASGLSVTASSNFSYKNSDMKFSDIKLNASAEIIGTSGLAREITLLKAQRNLTEAKRKLQTQAITAEKSFYTELKSLLNSTSSIINLQKTLYNNKIDFEKIKAQGYSTGSSTYRLAQMKVLSTEHDIENSTRSLIHDYVVFYKKCGYDISLTADTDFYDLIPADISEVEALDILSFNPDLYSEVESALWTNRINSMQRKAKSNFSLSANGGVTFNNSATDSTTVDAGISSTYGGLTGSTGISMPLGNNFIPAFTLSASVSPNTWKQNNITQQTAALDEKQELLSIETARANYATKVVDFQQSLEDLMWTKQSEQESYEMYVALEKDLSKWFRDGYISESEYYSAKVNVQSYTVKKIINTIDFIIYNDNIVTMFVDEIQEN